MSLPVHLVPSLDDVRVGTSVEVTGAEAHHAVVVRRLRVGEQVVLTDGRGRSAVGAVAETARGAFSVVVESVRDVAEPSPGIVVVQALPKGDRGELAVEVLTEVGVARIVPWAAARCVAVWKGERAEKSAEKWRATAREAAKQARRAWFPEVADLAATADVVRLATEAGLAIVLHEGATETLGSLAVPGAGTVLVVVGPEGGLTDDEVAVLVDAGAHAVRLGSEVLRTSTAGVAAVSAVLARTSRWA